jgi:asparaginyl-tRNA synthetase
MVDSRHLREFELLEEEVRYTHPLVAQELTAGGDDVRLQMLLARVSRTIKAMISSAITQCEAEIASLGGDVKALAQAVEERFPVITYREALDLLSYESRTQPRRWGSELTRRDEARLLQELSEGSEISRPVFVTYFPEELKFFNMKVDRGDQAVVCSADLLLPTSGEAVGAALREEDHRILTERFDRLMRPQLEASVGSHHTGLVGFDSYLAAVRSGRLQPHGGYGVGLERVLQFVFKAGDIRDVSVPTILAQW